MEYPTCPRCHTIVKSLIKGICPACLLKPMSHDEGREWRMCWRKLRYKTEAAATKAVRSLWRERGLKAGSTAVRCYECPYCHGFHVTGAKRLVDEQ